MKTTVLITLILATFQCSAQNDAFEFGVMTAANGYTMKLSGDLSFVDSVYTMKVADKVVTQKIVNRTADAVYVTDGTATNKLAIAAMTGKIKGFAYDHVITLHQDARFSNTGTVMYYCRKKT